MPSLFALFALASGPAIALAAGLAAWGCARAMAPRSAANDNMPMVRPPTIRAATPANDPSPAAFSDAAG